MPAMTRDFTGHAAASEPFSVEVARVRANRELDPARKSELGQFMTPSRIAGFMAELFHRWDRPDVRLLDAGAGIGSLTAAFLDAWLERAPVAAHIAATAYEIDPVMRRYLAGTLDHYGDIVRRSGRSWSATIRAHDFIAEGIERALSRPGPRFSHAILNPPYKKITSGSAVREHLRGIGLRTVNLYTAFLAVAVGLLADQGELVAIVPRSFCNGAYYRPFRAWIRQHAALTHIHLFERRDRAFVDDDVLQENIIVKWVRGAPQGEVTVSWCRDAGFADLKRERHAYSTIVHPDDPEGFIRVPTDASAARSASPRFACALDELGLSVSTGPVVDFRLRDHLRQRPGHDTVPLLYPQHFAGGGLRYPGSGKKPSAIVFNDETRRWLLPRGWYVVTKRFTSKEERRRVVAHVIDPAALPSPWLGLENHLNVFHQARQGLDPDLARGLAVFLNSPRVDHHFRVFSGHTQVNATDLRTLRYPPRDVLLRLGRLARARGAEPELGALLEQHA